MTTTAQETKTRYTFGYGHTHPPTRKWEVLLVTENAEGATLAADIVLTVPSQDKAKAIAMILNAPENY